MWRRATARLCAGRDGTEEKGALGEGAKQQEGGAAKESGRLLWK